MNIVLIYLSIASIDNVIAGHIPQGFPTTVCPGSVRGLCSLKIQDVNYFQNLFLFIQNSLPLNQYIAGID
jgi:hypothetical protein